MLDELARELARVGHTCTYYEPAGEPCPRCKLLEGIGAQLLMLDMIDKAYIIKRIRSQSDGGDPTQ